MRGLGVEISQEGLHFLAEVLYLARYQQLETLVGDEDDEWDGEMWEVEDWCREWGESSPVMSL